MTAPGTGETVCCRGCKLVQFVRNDKTCPRCHRTYTSPPAPTVASAQPIPEKIRKVGSAGIADLVRSARRLSGFSQRELALRMGVRRTYVSKIERGGVSPYPRHMLRMAIALGCNIAEILPEYPSYGAPADEQSLSELMQAAFEAVPNMSAKQRKAVLKQAWKLANPQLCTQTVNDSASQQEAS